MLSSHVASGNSFNASLFLIQFRDYPKEVDCRKANKKKEKKEEEENLKKVKTSWRAGRVDERCTIGGGMRIEKVFNEQKKLRLALKRYGHDYITNRYGMYCTYNTCKLLVP